MIWGEEGAKKKGNQTGIRRILEREKQQDSSQGDSNLSDPDTTVGRRMTAMMQEWGVGGPRGLPIDNLSLTSPEIFTSAASSETPSPSGTAVHLNCCPGDRRPFATRSVKCPERHYIVCPENTWQTDRQTHRQTDRPTDLWSCVCFSAYTLVHTDLSVCLSAVHVLSLAALCMCMSICRHWNYNCIPIYQKKFIHLIKFKKWIPFCFILHRDIYLKFLFLFILMILAYNYNQNPKLTFLKA